MVQVLLLLGGILLAQADAKAPEGDLAASVRRLVRQLDAPQLNERDAAEEELLRLGPRVLELLPQGGDASRPEVEERLGRIRQKLQRAQSETAVQPSRVTLRGDGLPLSKVLAAIQGQTGNKIVDARREAAGEAPDPKLKVDFDKTPFWQALDRVLDQAGLTVYPFGDDKAIRIVTPSGPQGPRTERAFYQGPFRFEPVSVAAQRDLRNPAGQVLKLELEVAWEPRLAPIAFQHRLADLKAVDESGKPLAVLSPEAELEVPVEPGPVGKRLIIPLALPPREVKRIARLRGILHVLVPGKQETFRFQNLAEAKNVEKRAAAVTVILEGVRKNNKLWELHTIVRFDRPEGALASHRNWVLDNPAFLEGRDGKPVPYDSMETTRQTPADVGVGYLFAVAGPLADYTFVYKTPAMIFSTPFEYEVKDVPLP